MGDGKDFLISPQNTFIDLMENVCLHEHGVDLLAAYADVYGDSREKDEGDNLYHLTECAVAFFSDYLETEVSWGYYTKKDKND